MKNKDVGKLLIGVSALIGILIYLFNKGLQEIIENTCTMGNECSMHSTVAIQTNLGLVVLGFVFATGLYLIYSKEEKQIIVRNVKEKSKRIDLKELDSVEKKVISILKRENGAFFQSSLMEELGVGKVKMTRMMDKLESRDIIERKRRGANNIIVLKR